MLYCTKCRAICDDSTAKCPNCKNHKSLRQVSDQDYVYLHRADEYTAQLLVESFEAAGVAYELESFANGRISYLYDSEVMPTDQSIFVKYSDIEKAKEISAALKEKLEKDQEEFQGEPMSAKKRIVIQVISVAAFLILVTVVVLLADTVAEAVKGFFTNL